MIDELLTLIKEAFKDNQFFQGGLVLGICMGVLASLKNVPIYLWSRIKRYLLFNITIYETDELFYYIEIWLNSKYPGKYRNVEAALKYNSGADSEGWSDSSELVYKQFRDSFTIFKDHMFFIFIKDRTTLENASDKFSRHEESFQITTLSKKKAMKLLNEIKVYRDEYSAILAKKSLSLYSCDQYGYLEKQKSPKVKPFNEIISIVKKPLFEDLQNWLCKRDFYEENHITYKRGYLLYGPPGTGKTSIILSLAKELGFKVVLVNLARLTDENLTNCMKKVEPGSFLVFEDIEETLKTASDESATKVTLSCLMNILDGSLSPDKVIFFLTSNHPEKLKIAMLREGRIDKKFELANSSTSEILEFTKLKYKELSNRQEREISKLPGNIPMVAVQNMYITSKNFNEYFNKLKNFKNKETFKTGDTLINKKEELGVS